MSYFFDGLDDRLTVSPGDLDNEQVTIFATIYPTTYGEAGRGFLVGHGSSAEPSNRYQLFLDDTFSGSVQALSFATNRATTIGRWRANSTVVLGVWQSCAATYDNTSTANVPMLYRNGVVLTSAVVSSPAGANQVNEPQPFYLGNSGTFARTFAGECGIFAVWNRVLAPSEVALVHHCGVRKVLRGLQLWYRGTGAISASAPDWTGLGRPATVTVTGISSDASGDRLAAS